MSIINMPQEIFDIVISHLMDDIDNYDIMDYYKQLLSIKLSCQTFLIYLKDLTYVDFIKTCFEKDNSIYLNYLKYIAPEEELLCMNPNCYNDTDEFWTEHNYPSPRYIHTHQYRSPGSYYCSYCKMNIILNAYVS